MPPDYSEAISRGVQNWLEANKETVLTMIRGTVESRVNASMEELARAMNKKVSSFFDDNKEEMIATMAAAIACMWQLKNHPPAGGST